MMYDPFSAHGCEHVLKRVWDEEVSWGRQGAAFRVWKHMPPMDAPLTVEDTFDRIPFGLDATKKRPNDARTLEEVEGEDPEELGLGDETGTFVEQHRRAVLRRRHGHTGPWTAGYVPPPERDLFSEQTVGARPFGESARVTEGDDDLKESLLGSQHV